MPDLGLPEIILIVAIAVILASALIIVPYWFIFRKAGFHPALAFLMVVPIASIVMPFFLAFAEWPSLKKSDPPTSQPS